MISWLQKKNECTFTMDGYEFDIEAKYIFNEKGEFTAYWNYLSEGPVVSKIEELKNDDTKRNGRRILIEYK